MKKKNTDFGKNFSGVSHKTTKGDKGDKTWNGKFKVSLFTGDMIIYIEDPKTSTKELIEKQLQQSGWIQKIVS